MQGSISNFTRVDMGSAELLDRRLIFDGCGIPSFTVDVSHPLDRYVVVDWLRTVAQAITAAKTGGDPQSIVFGPGMPQVKMQNAEYMAEITMLGGNIALTLVAITHLLQILGVPCMGIEDTPLRHVDSYLAQLETMEKIDKTTV